ncbi:hypothetical protein PSK29_04475 [Escherichia coli]|nr:hypothetical protein [Escherichia coli]
MATKLQDGNTPCLAATPSEPRPTVLVFDSGVGGLSVYDEIRHLLPDLHYIYAFDNVAFPYGEKSEAFIVERVVAIVTAVQERYPPCAGCGRLQHRQYRFASCITRKVRLPGCWCRAGD